ncbi:DUF177 domain-containing protein [Erythrobacter sp. JK5]|uniref:YceD family protein n=1 Tax=Erythrobacter sp. JK5 TaxID=2829500 RepID=UPI001BA52CF9|nr:DUF177 domain-containing protein [Erythrobacter sp. JK5]QUL36731.1 DUF177 domain-containing protein [Erythrobacter sp. JK5]
MSAPELSRPVKVRPLTGDPVLVEADAAERAALAERFGLSAVNSLRAEIELEAKGKAIRATGDLEAEIVQVCAVSAEDFPVSIREPIDLRFVPEGASAADEEEIELEADDCDEIEYAGETFDLGEAVAQTLGLAIDPYAEGPNAEAVRKAAGIRGDDAPSGPLAEALAALKKDD